MVILLWVIGAFLAYGAMGLFTYCLWGLWAHDQPLEVRAWAMLYWPIGLPRIVAAHIVWREKSGNPIRPLPLPVRLALWLAILAIIGLIAVNLVRRLSYAPAANGAPAHALAKSGPTATEEAAIVGPDATRAAYQAGLMNAAAKALTDPRDCLATPGELRSYRAGCLSFVESVRHRPKTT